MRCRAAVPAGLLAAAAAACQPLPRPFDGPDGAAPGPLAAPDAAAGVAVLDLAGAPAPVARALRPALVRALLDRGVPAAPATGSRRAAFVYGEAAVRAEPSGRVEVEAVWHVVDAAGRTVGRHRTAARPAAADWRSAEPGMIAALARSAADGIAALARGETPRAAPAPASGPRRLFVAPVRAPPPLDGAELRRAVAEALPGAGLRAAAARAAAALVLAGAVTLGPDGRVAVRWQLEDRARGGAVEIDQEGAAAPAALAAGWPALARTIARALMPELRAAAE